MIASDSDRHPRAGSTALFTVVALIFAITLVVAIVAFTQSRSATQHAAAQRARAEELEAQLRLLEQQVSSTKGRDEGLARLELQLADLKAELEREREEHRQTRERMENVARSANELAAGVKDGATNPSATEESSTAEEGVAPADAELEAARTTLAEALTGKGLLERFGSPAFSEEMAKLKKTLGDEGLDRLLEALASGTSQERLSAALLLEGWNDPAALPALEVAATQDQDSVVQRFSAHALAMIEGDTQVPVLQRIVADSTLEPGGRINAAFGLAVRGDDQGMQYLIDRDLKADLPPDLQGAILPAIAVAAEHSSPEVILPYLHAKITPEASLSSLYVGLSTLEKVGNRSSLPALELLLASQHPESLKDLAKKVINRIEGFQKHPVD